ncbi:NAD(P)/FAD-dependent oxidoreductase [Bacillaceae bacterium SIJ1]|uniref:NAD(P)/FAD-dependent oxidoreductase n=1 Tax=Litoribacterium kuwaitense TaxID=1398745 RepID=UPI0013EB1E00|nr:NAD(P)/FAD-dependent oxidoreductase [Litoribacterium kuwaitense]NGP45382.1 NAD(P)/FAD-dependent oxidoreductase [Litoribacterium kuwaitense]
MQNETRDVLVIGGGVVGTAILRKLSLYDLSITLVEKQPDLCEGASKANSGIVHTGFDAPPGSVEAECLKRSRYLWSDYAEQLKIPYIPTGAMMIATSEEEKDMIQTKYIPNAKENGVFVEWIEREEVKEMNPAVTDKVIGGLSIPGEAICDPFTATRSFAELAVLNGAEIHLEAGVTSIEETAQGFAVSLENGAVIKTKFIVNAAGVYSDQISRMIGDKSYTISPRKGQFILTEEEIEISQIVLPVPTPTSKGTLISPVVFGGFLLGPTAEDQEDKDDRSTSSKGMNQVLAGCEKLIPDAKEYESIRQFAGVRAVCSTGDYVIRASEKNSRFIHAAGIRSTGLSAAPGIAELVAETIAQSGLILENKEDALLETPNLFNDTEESVGEIVCLCRTITRSEITNALEGPIPPTTIDGVKRRTGATLGECQGNCCIPKILDLLSEYELNRETPLKGLKNSTIALKKGGE